MRNRSKLRLIASAIGAALLLSLPSIAQNIRMVPLKGNPYRDIGGSCVYDRVGKLVFAPKGARCTPPQDGLPANADAAASDGLGGLSPALHKEMMTILDGHAHIAGEIEKLRWAVAKDRKADALKASDHVVRELSSQLEREKRLFKKISAELAMRGS